MNCTEAQELLEAYALGALDPIDSRQVAAHISECSDCARIARAYQQAVDHLALDVPLVKASPRLKDRVMGGIGVYRPRTFAGRILNNRVFAAAAAFALFAVAVGGLAWAVILSREVSQLRDDNTALAELTQLDANQRAALLQLRGELSSAKNEQQRMNTTLDEQSRLLVVALDPQLVPSELAGTNVAPNSACNYVWSRTQGIGALTCKDIPSTATNLNYQLWAQRGDKTLSLGTFTPRLDGTASVLVRYPSGPDAGEGPLTDMWVTLETRGVTAQRPSGQMILQRIPPNQASRDTAGR
jgi:anti-sigma-K factor RskA